MFGTFAVAKVLTEAFQEEHITVSPHSYLGYRKSAVFTATTKVL
jgi:hypothetical protein